MYGRPLTIEDHQNSQVVADPYHLLDISLVSDGGIAFILTTADRAKDRPKPPVYVLGQGFGEVIVQDRNQVAVDDLKKLIEQEPGTKSVAILWANCSS